jgi:hypothetical protein
MIYDFRVYLLAGGSSDDLSGNGTLTIRYPLRVQYGLYTVVEQYRNAEPHNYVYPLPGDTTLDLNRTFFNRLGSDRGTRSGDSQSYEYIGHGSEYSIV